MVDTELAWAAGFFDGEGCVRLIQNRYARLSITQRERICLDRFYHAVGDIGSLSTYKGGTYGDIYWRYECSRQSLIDLIYERLSPWLSEPKRAQFADVFSASHRYIALA